MILKGRNAALMEQFELGRALNNELARLVSFSVSDPRKMPEYKPLKKRAAPEVSTEVDDARVRAFFVGLAARSSK